MRFADTVFEQQYIAERFTRVYPLVTAYCVGMSVSCVLHTIAFPEALVGDAIGATLHIVLFLHRAILERHLEDCYRANLLFSYSW